MSVTKNNTLIRLVRKQLAGGYEKKESLPTPQSRFEKLGTLFTRTTGLIKSGVIPSHEIPIWYSVYKAFPPKYEPKFKRPPLDIDIKEIYYPEDKLRAANRRWATLDLASTTPNASQLLVATFREKRTTSSNDDNLIEELLKSKKKVNEADDIMSNLISEAVGVPLG